jgi:hypothetical protein
MTTYECSWRAAGNRRLNPARRSLLRRIPAWFVRHLRWVVLLTASLCVVSVLAQSASTIPPTATMKTFVIIFRQGPQQLTESDKQRRAEETVAWARGQNAAGHRLDPRILAPESEHRGPGNSSSDGWPVTALLFLEAHDLSEATQIAEAHPAIRYGSEIEVRPWAPPVPSGTATASPAGR